jgi:aminopeptidase-like protein
MIKSNGVLSFKQCTEVINDACNGDEALGFAKEISAFHRIQASRGYRAAAEHTARLLQESGVDVCIRSYPADGCTHCFTQKLFKEWNCTEGWLEINVPWQERLSDFNREEMSIIQRSADKDFSNKDIPIMYVGDSIVPADFNTSLAGAMLFVENGFDKWIDRAIELGALSIITVSMPEIKPVRVNMSEDRQMADSHANLSFHLYSEEQENKLCGFAISPGSGKRLREACIAMAAEERMPMARFKVSSTLKEGFIENVDAVIPGDTDEEILMVAHLCHPRSSVNDNASGAAAAMEAMCTLGRLIKDGALPRPRRTVRLLLIPEFTGTYAFLKENEDRLSKIVAGINLDMVAGYQNGKAGALIIVDTPDSAHSFSGDLSSIIMDELSKECTFGGKDRYVPLFLGVKVPFAFGSDHYILSDPTVDIPAVALTQWPDKTYHTSADSLDHIDPSMLRRAAALAGSYCYIYSRFTLADAEVVIPAVSSRFFNRISSLRKSSDAKERCEYTRDLYFATLNRISSLLDEKGRCEILPVLEDEKRFFLCLEQISCEGGEKKVIPASPVPIRLFKAPLAMRSIIGDMTSAEKEKLYDLRCKYPNLDSLDDYIMYEADGKRTVEDIACRVYFQTGVECGKYVKELFEMLTDLDLAKFN